MPKLSEQERIYQRNYRAAHRAELARKQRKRVLAWSPEQRQRALDYNRKYQAAWGKKHPERRRAALRRHYLKHQNKILRRRRARSPEQRERDRQSQRRNYLKYRADRRAYARAASRRARIKNPEKIRAAYRRHYVQRTATNNLLRQLGIPEAEMPLYRAALKQLMEQTNGAIP